MAACTEAVFFGALFLCPLFFSSLPGPAIPVVTPSISRVYDSSADVVGFGVSASIFDQSPSRPSSSVVDRSSPLLVLASVVTADALQRLEHYNRVAADDLE